MGIDTVKAVGRLKEGDNLFHTGKSLAAGDVAAVDTGQNGHNAETAAAGGHNVPVVFGIDAVHVDALGGEAAVRFGAVPEVIESTPLYGIHQGFVAHRNRLAVGTFALCEDRQQQEE